ncbi:hypothetical protein JOD63_001614 [Microbacterium terrae]|uniref:Glycosyl hydrolase family 65 central catalytic domain protein n=1 Tax=Microbacterium terrae TaxID=69369 RepID=A0A0M2H4D0_9MICO|nr:hypothetical protein [Microbacterium terrae]KJL41316.1 Glycosyl hydrolase family 65 central catalytic domain protein [Microbacterium terrae]MBP1077646.1 hypothetical protein [Microbacterium terrae]GLJ99251.1 hypothetical protein GCM10017594_24480 [Microbacterium terrae]
MTTEQTRPTGAGTPIDRAGVVSRHKLILSAADPENVVSMGNGDFAFNADLTGMQSFPAFHDPVVGQREGRTVVNTTTMSSWGWHSMPNPAGYVLGDAMTTYETARGAVSYPDKHDMMGAMTGAVTDEFKPGAWLNANPQRIDLGRIGVELRSEAGSDCETDPRVLGEPHQELDLWTGVLSSEFTYAGERAHVETVSAADGATVAFRVDTRLLVNGRARIVFRFPYASDGFFATDDWSAVDAHRSDLSVEPDGTARIRRTLDATRYVCDIAVSDGSVVRGDSAHHFVIETSAERIDVVVRFSPTADAEPLPSFDDLRATSVASWEEFWLSGAAIDLSRSTDPRAHELERRVVLSQYLTRVHSAGHLPPAETGLVTNSWQGKFHLEMHLWHGAHFASWGRPGLLERSLAWYPTILDQARATAERQNYPGARWPKQTGPEGEESPSDIGSLLAWQQPHILHMLESVWSASSAADRQRLLLEFSEVVSETATFMAAYAEERDGVFHLGSPIMPAQEFYDPRATTDPTFELAYWWWGLEIAQRWRERTGLARNEDWSRVQEGLDAPFVDGGRYAAVATREPLRRDDHPSLLMAYGVVPSTPLIDPVIMRETLTDVWRSWDWPTAWGWDFPVMAMTAARLDEPALALDALLRPEGKNRYTAVGHNPQMGSMLPLYLPGNGGLLLAVAVLAETGCFDAPGWHAALEGFVPSAQGSGYDARRTRVEPPREPDAPEAPLPLSAESTIGEWLDHPVGAVILGDLLSRMGAASSSLVPLRGAPLTQLVAISNGAIPESVIEGLAAAANAGAGVEVSP